MKRAETQTRGLHERSREADDGQACQLLDEEKPGCRSCAQKRFCLVQGMDMPDAEIFCVKIKSFLLLDGVSEAHFETL